MDKNTFKSKKVNFLLGNEVVEFLDNMKAETGLTQSKVVSMLVHRYGFEMKQDLEKYSRKEKAEDICFTSI